MGSTSLRITHSLPPLAYDALERAEAALDITLPPAYRRFLLRSNGGLLEAGPREFTVPAPREFPGRRTESFADSLVELYGVAGGGEAAAEALGSLVELNLRYRDEEFLPGDVLAVGRCLGDSLVCLATGAGRAGEVLYWDYCWQYPWARAHFEARVQAVRAAHPDYEAALEDSDSPLYQAALDAFNYATLTSVAPDFEAFLAGLRPESEAV